MSLIAKQATTPPRTPYAVRRTTFRLLRYFTVAALVSLLTVGLALYFLEEREVAFFQDVQKAQSSFFREAQAELAVETEQTARRSLVAAQEAANVNLTQFFANTLWDSHFAPFTALTRTISLDRCRAIASGGSQPPAAAANPRQECFAEIGLKIKSLPGFAALDQRATASMRNSNVFKIKVYDLRGLTVYSSDHRNIGEDKIGNAGWRSAAAGRAASELTYRDHFSAFEGIVENRDLISSYIPVRRGGGKEVVGVFEIYADVTPLLEQIKTSSMLLASLVAGNQGKIERTSQQNLEKVAANSTTLLKVVAALFVLLFAALLYIVRRGQSIIDQQILAQEQNAARERLWHQEKMSAMSTMAANVSHETGNALSVISATAQKLAAIQEGNDGAADAAAEIMDQCRRVFQMTRQISAFATASDHIEFTNVNPLIEAVCYFFSFDRRFRSPIEFRPAENLPWCDLIPDFLKEVLMNLLPTLSGHIVVATAPCSVGVRIRIHSEAADGEPAPQGDALLDSRVEIASRRIEDMGGTLSIAESGKLIEIELPACMREDSPH
ncbi:MAG: histidine kinase [Betaproteobacteria bacterium]|nr:histidine kinase [Betaproteobacteria bacterium]